MAIYSRQEVDSSPSTPWRLLRQPLDQAVAFHFTSIASESLVNLSTVHTQLRMPIYIVNFYSDNVARISARKCACDLTVLDIEALTEQRSISQYPWG